MKKFQGTIYRLPVIKTAGSLEPLQGQLPRELLCMDFDPETGAPTGTTACEDAFRAKHGKFKCPGIDRGTCGTLSFLYPRKFHGEDAIHRHQGIDIAWGHAGASIVSVCDGVVEKAARVYESGVGGYGRTIVIRGEETGEPRWYLYAHCKTIDASVEVGRDVRAGQVIGTVGLSDTAGKFIFDPKNENGAHLHFEVSASKYWKKQYIEESNQNHFVPGATPPLRARLDPLAELARLGPWGMAHVFMPTAAGDLARPEGGEWLRKDSVAAHHVAIETRPTGGYFPLGANNDWHGGVHLRAPSSSTIVAPFDADIVAFRLDADPVKSLTDAGHTNFILLRHKMAETAARMFVGKPPLEPAPGKKAKPPSVGRDGTNEPDLVIKVKSGLAQRLKDGTPMYHPADPLQTLDPTADEELYQAIETFQRTLAPPKAKKKKKKPPPPWPDGLMTVNGYSWISLFGAPTKEKAEPTTPAEGPKDEPGVPTKDGGDPRTHEPTAPAPGDREPRVYSLLMHLGPHAFDASAVKRFPWLGRATMVPREEDESERAAARKREEREADRNEAQHTLKRRVGFPPVPEDLDDIGSADIDPGDTDDIRWVQQRLRRLAGYAGEADGTWVEDMRPVIIEFQRAHTKYFKKHLDEAQGYVMPKGQTYKALKRTAVDLFGEEDDPAVDEVLQLRASERDDVGHVRVVSGLKIPVKSGEPLWIPGLAEGVIPDVEPKDSLLEQIHWEIFSESNVTDWETIVDPDENRTANLSPELYAQIEIDRPLSGFAKDQQLVAAEVREFFNSGRAEFLRRRACQFRSLWNADNAAWVKTLTDLGFDPADAESLLDAYKFWPAAADVLPKSSHVFHYNPIEFLGRYAEILDALRPPPPSPPKPPPELCVLRVEVVYADGQPWSYASVALAFIGEAEQVRAANVRGVVEFDNLDGDKAGFVWIVGDATSSHAVVFDARYEEIVLEAAVPGPGVSTGAAYVTVRDGAGSPVSFVDVVLRDDGDAEIVQTTGMDGVAAFLQLAPGEYVARTAGAHPLDFAMVAEQEEQIELLQTELGALQVTTRFQNGTVATGLDVNADCDGAVMVGTRVAAGVVAFSELLPGDYVVFVPGEPQTQIEVSVEAGATEVVDLIVPEPAPQLPGGIVVTVRDAKGTPQAGERVSLLDDDNRQIDEGNTNSKGKVEFVELDPGSYGVSSDHGTSDQLAIRVKAGESVHVDIEVPATTGTLLVTVVYTDGEPVYGTLKVTTIWFGAVAHKQLQGSGDAEFSGLEAGRYLVYLDGFDDHAISVDLPAGATVPVPIILPGVDG